MQNSRFIGFLAALTASASGASAENWKEFNECVDSYATAVDQSEPSIHGGADLIVNVLCISQAAALATQMVHSRPNVVSDHGGTGPAFETFLHVMEREVKGVLFDVRRKRLGI